MIIIKIHCTSERDMKATVKIIIVMKIIIKSMKHFKKSLSIMANMQWCGNGKFWTCIRIFFFTCPNIVAGHWIVVLEETSESVLTLHWVINSHIWSIDHNYFISKHSW